MVRSEETVVVPRRKLEYVARLAREHGERLKRGAADLDRSIEKMNREWEEMEERHKRERRRSY